MNRLEHSLKWTLIGLALLLSAANAATADSKHSWDNRHQAQSDPQNQAVQHQEPQVPLSALLIEAISAIKKQAEAEQKQADSNQQGFCSPSVIVNEALVFIGVGYLIFMGLQWKAIGRQADIAGSTLKETSRPWIAPLVQPIGDGLTFDANGARILINKQFLNTGHSPGMDVRTHVWLIVCKPEDHPVEIQRRRIEEAEQHGAADEIGVVLFPNAPFGGGQELHVSQVEIDRAKSINGQISAYVAGFVSYRFAFPDEGRIHCTRFLYEIARFEGGVKSLPIAGRNIAFGALLFSAYAAGGHESD
jgi:hypothetical protein